MKILVLNNYQEKTGYSIAGQEIILAMNSIKLDVVPRRLKFSNRNEAHPKVEALELKSEFGCDIILQITLPCYFQYDGRFKKNIGYFFWETDRLCPAWVKSCNSMDEIWVANKQQVAACKRSGVAKPIYVVPIPCDVNKYTRSFKIKHPIIQKLKESDNFTFYTIGEFVKRKNHLGLLRAFHAEFAPEEPVDLVIKTSRDGLSPAECHKMVSDYCTEVKQGMRIYGNNLNPYKQEIIITDHLSDDDMMGLHKACDCFVQPSYGESWSIPAFDAMAFGKSPVVPNSTGYLEYCFPINSYLIRCETEPVWGVKESQPDLYTAKENWEAPVISEIMKQMRLAYNERGRKDTSITSNFSYERVGNHIKTLLS